MPTCTTRKRKITPSTLSISAASAGENSKRRRQRTNLTAPTVASLLSLIFCLMMSIPYTKPETMELNTSMSDAMIESIAGEYDVITEEYDVISPRLGSALCCVPCLDAFDNQDDIIVEGNAFDVIVVESENHHLYQNSEFLVSFARPPEPTHKIILEIRGDEISNTRHGESKAWFPVIRVNESAVEGSDDNDTYDPERYWGCCHPQTYSGKISDLNGALDEVNITSKLAPFLKPGKNPIRYLLLDEQKVIGVAHANIFLWSHNDSVVVSDIDGTITKSNARGVIDTILTENYRYCHEGICNLLSSLAQIPNTQTLYVTSRPIRLASHTRQFIANLRQGENRLPEGPILGFGGNIPQLLVMELISMKTHHFKADILWKQVVLPFRKVKNSSSASPVFLAGLGNTLMDVQAYHMAGIDLGKIYLIDKKSRISSFDKQVNQEVANLTRTNHGLFSATVGIPMPRKWYKEKMGTSFKGYSDHNLRSHVLSHLDNDMSFNVGQMV